MLAAGSPSVRSAVALAPWVYPTDIAPGLDDQQILIVHGTRDRIASPQRSVALARALETHTDVAFVSVTGAKHAMLRRHAVFDGLAADFACATLLGTRAGGVMAASAPASIARGLTRMLARRSGRARQ